MENNLSEESNRYGLSTRNETDAEPITVQSDSDVKIHCGKPTHNDWILKQFRFASFTADKMERTEYIPRYYFADYYGKLKQSVNTGFQY